jgi:VIT1/CCC1 family predicted Fe2+/Mn2+ transporter
LANLKPEIKKHVIEFQKTELTEYYVYKYLGNRIGGRDGEILNKIAEDELRHYNEWKKYSGEDVKPSKLIILLYKILSIIFGYTFAIKLMEKGEERAQINYTKVVEELPEAGRLVQEELEHENELIEILDEERLRYISSVVLGMNDALVELTGALAGLTFALQNTLLVGVAALITGLAASLSMAASEYLSQRSEGALSPPRAAFYTGIAYVVTVMILVIPFFIFPHQYTALTTTLINAVIIIFIFSFFISVTRDMSFKTEFIRMLIIGLGVAFISFLIGMVMNTIFHIEL